MIIFCPLCCWVSWKKEEGPRASDSLREFDLELNPDSWPMSHSLLSGLKPGGRGKESTWPSQRAWKVSMLHMLSPAMKLPH